MTTGAGPLVLGIALVGLFAAAPAALRWPRASYAVAATASLALVAAGVIALLFGNYAIGPWNGAIGEAESLRMDALSGFFAIVAGSVWVATSVYSIRYDVGHGPGLPIAYAATLGSIAVLLVATDFLVFLAAWEGMTLSAYWMILEAEGRAPRIFGAAFVFLAFGEASTVLVAVVIASLYAGTGSFAMTSSAMAGPLASVAFVAAVVGFGLKMGVAPFHMSEWLPIAHSSAPSNASAVLSSTLTLAGVYGLFRVLTLLAPGPAWWGGLLLVIGAISALLGAIFASVSEHVKGLPAYSTIENNGLILVALGIALIAMAEGLPALATFALFAAFFQAFAHAITKAGLFLFAGDVERATGTYDLSRARGIIRRADPLGSGATVVAALSLAAAPPLAGFVSEWMILESLFQSYQFSSPPLVFLGLLAGAVVALAAGLVLVAMLKFVGFTALWKPDRGDGATVRTGLGPPIAGLTAIVVGLGVASPWILRGLAPSVSVLAGTAVAAPVGGLLAVPVGWSIVSGGPQAIFGILSPPALPIAFGVGVLPAVAYYLGGRRPPSRRLPPWSGGRALPTAQGWYTSFGYSTGLRIMLRSVLGTREVRRAAGARGIAAEIRTPESYNVELEVLDVFKAIYDGLVRLVLGASAALKAAVMPGRIGRYLAYILGVVILVVIYVAVAFGAV
ncbi:MAG: proton-conducting transporter membrane subunit [Thermoplasmata archaeon]